MSQKKVRENALLSFETVCGFLDNCVSAPDFAARVKHLRTLLETYLNREADDLYQVFRLLHWTVAHSPRDCTPLG